VRIGALEAGDHRGPKLPGEIGILAEILQQPGKTSRGRSPFLAISTLNVAAIPICCEGFHLNNNNG
jgi:hypothetical protein